MGSVFCPREIELVHICPHKEWNSWTEREFFMAEEVMVRGRKSLKHGITHEYRFEIAPVDGKRKWSSKGGFLSERAQGL